MLCMPLPLPPRPRLPRPLCPPSKNPCAAKSQCQGGRLNMMLMLGPLQRVCIACRRNYSLPSQPRLSLPLLLLRPHRLPLGIPKLTLTERESLS